MELEARGKMSILDIKPKSQILKDLGLPVQEVLDTINIAVGGKEVGILYEGMRGFPIIIRLPDENRENLKDIENLPVGLDDGSTIKLSEVAKISFTESYSSFSREETKRRIAILINPRGRDTESFIKEVQEKISDVKLPPGYYLEWGGNFKNLNEAKSRLSVLGPLALILVFMMIYAAFRNVFEAGVVFLCVPLALVGGAIALAVKGIPFSVSAGVGFIALSGIAVLNGVVLVNNFHRFHSQGKFGKEAIVQGSILRLRPVLMTALTDIFGFLPMALATGLGAEVQRPLATVIIGGIISSTVLTLIVLPAVYSALEKRIIKPCSDTLT